MNTEKEFNEHRLQKVLKIFGGRVFNINMHAANCGEDGKQKSVTNAQGDTFSFISNEKCTFMANELMKIYNSLDENKGETVLTNGDKKTGEIKNDITSDLFGYMIPDKNKKRRAVFNISNSVAMNPQLVLPSFIVRFDTDGTKHTPVPKELSVEDNFWSSFTLDVSRISTKDEDNEKVNSIEEIKRRIALAIKSSTTWAKIGHHGEDVNASYVIYVLTDDPSCPTLNGMLTNEENIKKYLIKYNQIREYEKDGKAIIIEGGINPFTKKNHELSVYGASKAVIDYVENNEI